MLDFECQTRRLAHILKPEKKNFLKKLKDEEGIHYGNLRQSAAHVYGERRGSIWSSNRPISKAPEERADEALLHRVGRQSPIRSEPCRQGKREVHAVAVSAARKVEATSDMAL